MTKTQPRHLTGMFVAAAAFLIVFSSFPLAAPVRAANAPALSEISAGSDASTCGVTSAGRAYCWGRDTNSQQLGNGIGAEDQASPSPVDVSALPAGASTTWDTVLAGNQFACGLTSDGVAYCWGSDSGGRLGDGPRCCDDQPSPSPVDMSGLPGATWAAITTGFAHACGVTTQGVAYCWGQDWSGQLGNGAVLSDDQPSPSPVDMSGLPPGTRWATLSAGTDNVQPYTCGVTTEGAAYCWGNDGSGELGNGAIADSQQSPSPVDVSSLPPGTQWLDIAAGNWHTCGMSAAGLAYCWGDNRFGQLGNGDDLAGNQVSPSPVDAAPGTTWSSIDAGAWQTCGIAADGVAYCWGYDAHGELGNGAVLTENQLRPSPVDTSALPLSTWSSVRTGTGHTCGLTTAGTAHCWGRNLFGELGTGTAGGLQASPGQAVTITDSVLADQTTVVGAIGDPGNGGLVLTLVPADPEAAVEDINVAVASSNETVLPNANIAVSGAGAVRAVTFEPTGRGTSSVVFTLTSADGTGGSVTIGYAASNRAPDPSGRYHGHISDASAALDVGDGYMLVADDETNVLFLYRQGESGPPVKAWDFTGDAELGGSELDIESMARTGDTIVWVSSHGNSRSGGIEERRRVTFATTISGVGADVELTFAGRYGSGSGKKSDIADTNLRADLIAWDQTDGHGLGADALGFFAATRPRVLPNAPNGFNVEGFEFAPDGTTGYFGFRAPTIQVEGEYMALIVPVTNILELVDGVATTYGIGEFGAPIFLDLDGRSIRDLRRNADDEYLISAGPSPQNETWALYTWDGNPAHQPRFNRELPAQDLLAGGSWEAIVAVPEGLAAGAQVRLVADSGDTDFYGTWNLTQEYLKFYSQLFALAVVPGSPESLAIALEDMPDSSFRGSGNRTAALAILDAAQKRAEDGDTAQAVREVEDLLRRIDGCGATPDVNDWIVDCDGQLEMRWLLGLFMEDLAP